MANIHARARARGERSAMQPAIVPRGKIIFRSTRFPRGVARNRNRLQERERERETCSNSPSTKTDDKSCRRFRIFASAMSRAISTVFAPCSRTNPRFLESQVNTRIKRTRWRNAERIETESSHDSRRYIFTNRSSNNKVIVP